MIFMDFAGVLFDRQRAALARLLLGSGRAEADGGETAGGGRGTSARRKAVYKAGAVYYGESGAAFDGGLSTVGRTKDSLKQGRVRKVGTGFRGALLRTLGTPAAVEAEDGGPLKRLTGSGLETGTEDRTWTEMPAEVRKLLGMDARRDGEMQSRMDAGRGESTDGMPPVGGEAQPVSGKAERLLEDWAVLRRKYYAESIRENASPGEMAAVEPVDAAIYKAAELGETRLKKSGGDMLFERESLPQTGGDSWKAVSFAGETVWKGDAETGRDWLPMAGGAAAPAGGEARNLSRAFQRDARRYDGGFPLF